MIEKIIRDYLLTALSVPVDTERGHYSGTYVLLEKTGGSTTNFLNNDQIAIQSYAPSLYEASVLNERVKDAMALLHEIPCVSAARLNSDYNFTDTTTKDYRYQAVFDVAYFEE